MQVFTKKDTLPNNEFQTENFQDIRLSSGVHVTLRYPYHKLTVMRAVDVLHYCDIKRLFVTISHHVSSVPGGLVPQVIKRSVDQFAAVGSTSFAYQASCFFSRISICLPT